MVMPVFPLISARLVAHLPFVFRTWVLSVARSLFFLRGFCDGEEVAEISRGVVDQSGA